MKLLIINISVFFIYIIVHKINMDTKTLTMNKQITSPFKLTALALATSALLSGCGSDDNSTKTQSATPTASVQKPELKPQNNAPTLSLMAEQTVAENSITYITLDAKDIDGDELNFSWRQTQGTAVKIEQENNRLKLLLPSVEKMTTADFEISVSDGKSAHVTESISLSIYPVSARPSIIVSENQRVEAGQKVTLTGEAYDDGEIKSLAWSIHSQDKKHQVELTQTTPGTATFVAPDIGYQQPVQLQFSLDATDDTQIKVSELYQVTVMPKQTELVIAHQGTKEGRFEFLIDYTLNSHLAISDLKLKWSQINIGPKLWIRLDDEGQIVAVTPNVQEPTDYLIAVTATDEFERESTTEFGLTVIPSTSIVEKKAIALNDTGVTTCANESEEDWSSWPPKSLDNNWLDCNLTEDEAGIAIPQGQDGHYGRDTDPQLTKIGAGAAGFDFTKLDHQGKPLPADAPLWHCVKDNHTGAIWEAKQTTGLHSATHTYTWYNPNNVVNGGHPGHKNGGVCTDSECDTLAFVKAVNEAGLCGLNNWRLPDINDLLSIVHFATPDDKLMIDQQYFKYTQPASYWSGQAFVGEYLLDAFALNEAMSFHFGGGLQNMFKKDQNHVRLVSTPVEE